MNGSSSADSAAAARWRLIPDCGGRYYVSDAGEVRSTAWKNTNALGVEKSHRAGTLKPAASGWGHLFVKLSLPGGGERTAYIHQLVCAAFVGPKPFPKAEALHWDDDRSNNHWTNLRWGTSADNAQDRARNGLSPVGERNGIAKLTDELVLAIKASDSTNAVAARDYGVSPTTISRIRSGKQWAHVAPKSATPEAVWRVCHVLTADCKRCAPEEEMPPHGLCVRGCYHQAEECVNTVETGNPWRKTEGVRAPFAVNTSASAAAWRPIETAPKDGTSILIWDGQFIEHVAWYWITKRNDCGWWAIRGHGDAVTCNDWGSKRDYAVDPEDDGVSITHWMPLPDPPQPVNETRKTEQVAADVLSAEAGR